MVKLHVLLALAALFFSAALARPTAPSSFLVQGKVYCDNCRAGFETTITEFMKGAKVKLVCENTTTNAITYTADGLTDTTGTYSIPIKHDHEEELCEVILVSSPLKECNEVKDGRDRARVVVTGNSGIASNVRFANSLGFLRGKPLDMCGALLAQYSLGDDN